SNLSGNLAYKNSNSSPLNSSAILLKQNGNTVSQTFTNDEGYYLFENLSIGNFSLDGSISKPCGGANAVDALLVLRHFVGTTPLTGLNLKAADVDATGYINSTDALLIAKRFVGMINSFNSGNWCIEKPIITISGLANVTQNIHALCYGDVDGSHNPGAKTDFQFALSGQPTFIEKDNEEIIIPIYAQSAVSVGSVSFIADVPDYLEVTGVVMPSDEHAVFLQNGRELRIAWYSMDPLEVNAGEPLFSLRAHLVKEPQPPVVLELNPSSLPSLLKTEESFAVWPSPADEFLNLQFSLPSDGNYTVKMVNLLGQEWKIINNKDGKKGLVSDLIKVSSFSPGFYYVDVEVNTTQILSKYRKSIIIK
ncbi:MAG: dockerin type I domain-containing protein, partial [Bacteroidetes bacterium]|nr:dockerin type I domain-containing protein [Bacteroidota bacterium]